MIGCGCWCCPTVSNHGISQVAQLLLSRDEVRRSLCSSQIRTAGVRREATDARTANRTAAAGRALCHQHAAQSWSSHIAWFGCFFCAHGLAWLPVVIDMHVCVPQPHSDARHSCCCRRFPPQASLRAQMPSQTTTGCIPVSCWSVRYRASSQRASQPAPHSESCSTPLMPALHSAG
jgi:hypothetical protein